MSIFIPAVYVLVPATAAVLAVILAVLAWHRRPAPGAVPFTAVFLSATVWSFAYAMELLSTEPGGSLFWGRVSYFGIVALPAAWLLFALAYTGSDAWKSPVTLGVLAVEPAVLLYLVWTYPANGLVWTEAVPTSFEGIVVMQYHYGPAFYIGMAYAYLLLLLGVGVIVRQLRQVPAGRRPQLGAVLIGALLPGVGNLLSNVGLRPTPPLNLTHLGFSVAGLLFFWAFFEYGLLNFREVARDRTFESIDTPVVLVDPAHRVVDLNPAAAAVLGVPLTGIEGRPLDALLPAGQQVFAGTGERIYNDEVVLNVDGASRPYTVDVTTVYFPIQQELMGQVVQFLPPTGPTGMSDGGPDDPGG